MYYFMMKTALKPGLKSETLCISKSSIIPREKEINIFNNKFYQNLLVVFISLSTFLIIPESPRELENICNDYNSKKLCIIW